MFGIGKVQIENFWPKQDYVVDIRISLDSSM